MYTGGGDFDTSNATSGCCNLISVLQYKLGEGGNFRLLTLKTGLFPVYQGEIPCGILWDPLRYLSPCRQGHTAHIESLGELTDG